MNKLSIQYCSDLHLEFKANENYLLQNSLVPQAEILILAGDILPFRLLEKHRWFPDWCAANFETTYWIPGNHEYYHFDLADVKIPLNEKIRENVILLNNQVVTYKTAELVFTTLWSYIPPQSEYIVQQSVNDFNLIKNKGKKFTAADFNTLHQTDFEFLNIALANPTGKQRIVITHHIPTMRHYPVQYKNSPINVAFATELCDTIENSNASHWIYGHHHYNIPPFIIGSTTLLTQPVGLCTEQRTQNF
ncbi:MAG: metallophosphoesterase [Bacteroidota bacterium]